MGTSVAKQPKWRCSSWSTILLVYLTRHVCCAVAIPVRRGIPGAVSHDSERVLLPRRVETKRPQETCPALLADEHVANR